MNEHTSTKEKIESRGIKSSGRQYFMTELFPTAGDLSDQQKVGYKKPSNFDPVCETCWTTDNRGGTVTVSFLPNTTQIDIKSNIHRLTQFPYFAEAL